MKLFIRESSYLFEDIDSVRKYYPRIPDNIFMQLIALDPTYRNNNSLGKYGKWILNLYNKGSLSEDEFGEVTPLLNQFTIYRNRIQNKDLNAYKSLQELSNVLSQVVDDDSMLTDRQKLRFKKNLKAGRISIDAEDDYDVVLDTPDFIVYVPNTHEASMKLGKGTKWCTAHEDPRPYEHYTEGNGKLYIVKDKKSGDRWQYSDQTDDFLDSNDMEFNIPELLRRDPELSKFFSKFLKVDFYNFNGTWVYDGTEIPVKLEPIIEKVIIQDGVKYISKGAFYGSGLKSVIIPNSVKSIGGFAFAWCKSLESVNIPDSVTHIDAHAFYGCDLKSVTIPNSVKKIGDYAFARCKSLEYVNIPDSVERMGNCVFLKCDKLTIYTNNTYIIDYCSKNGIEYKPLSKEKSESINYPLRLCIREDTCCIPSKTSYMEDGMDKNGIYYFGKKPKLPMNWRDVKMNDIKKLTIKESTKNARYVADEYGRFTTLDDEFDMVGNTPDDEIDEIVRHLEKIQKFFRKNPSEIVSYGCADGWLDPLHNREFFETPFKPFSKRNPYSTYIGEYENHDIIVDHMDSRFDFTIYALSEDTIYQIMEKIGGE